MKNIKKIKADLNDIVNPNSEYKDRERSVGIDVVDMLGLKIDKNDRVNTSWGSKTVKGLGASIIRIVEENN
jgi:hypothetical protein